MADEELHSWKKLMFLLRGFYIAVKLAIVADSLHNGMQNIVRGLAS